jgi:drug/metabolite transporter (DMT)-like permease
VETIVIAAMVGAALLHSSWHAMVKASGDRIVSLAGINVVSTSLALCAVPFVAMPSQWAWAVLAVSVLLHGTYKFALARLYRLGDLSHAYPLARGLSPALAALLAAFWLGEWPSPSQWLGLALVSGGLAALALEGRKRAPSPMVIAYAALAGSTVAAYSVLDAYGARLNGDWRAFTVWLVLLDGSAFVSAATIMRGQQLWRTIGRNWRVTLVSGLFGTVSFSIFLWALSRGTVGAVASLRELSVLFASVIGMVVLREGLSLPRLGGVLLVTGGVLALAMR